MAQDLKIELEIDETGAIIGLNKVARAIDGIPKSARPATESLRNLKTEQKQASDAADLLGARLGVHLPREVRKFIGQTKLIGPALATAFNVSIFLALGAAIFEAVKNIDKLTDKIVDWDGKLKRNRENVATVNELLVEHSKKITEMNRAYELLGVSGIPRTRKELQFAQEDFKNATVALAGFLQAPFLGNVAIGPQVSVARERAKLGGKEPLSLVQEVLRATPNPSPALLQAAVHADQLETALRAANKNAELVGAEEGKKRLDEMIQKAKQLVSFEFAKEGVPGRLVGDAARAAAGIFEKPSLSGALGLPEGPPDTSALERFQELRNENKRLALEVAQNSKDFVAVQGIRIAEIDKEIQRWKDDALIVEQLEQKKRFVIHETNLEIAQDAKDKFERTAQTIEGFFDRVFLTARSFTDVFRQLWTQGVNWVVKQIARMVAAWFLAKRQMSQISIGGGGGAGGLLGGLLSLSTATAGGLATGGGSVASRTGLVEGALSSVFGPAIPRTGASAGGVSGTGAVGGGVVNRGVFGGTGGVGLGASLAGVGGGLLSRFGIGIGNPALGAIGGFFAGGAAGLAIGSTFLDGTALGAFAGPIGALIGASIGAILAIRNRGKQKRLSADIHEEYLRAQKKILDDFERHKTSHDSAVGNLTAVFDSSVAALRSLGSPGRRTIKEIRPEFDATLKRLDDLQRVRDARSATIKGLPIPSFAHGGIVGFAKVAGGGVIAMLHPGEAVLNPKATQKLGEGNVERLNSGQNVNGITVNIFAVDGPSVESWIKRNRRPFTKAMRQFARDAGRREPF